MKNHSGDHTCYAPREKQAEKILGILADFLGDKFLDLNCLDIGCSVGIMSRVFVARFMQVIAFDVDPNLVRQAAQNGSGAQPSFLIADGGKAPFSDGSFDVIVCAQIYEHTTHQKELFAEIGRLLRPDGVCFFSGPNKLILVEEHYWLPFLSWLPGPLANLYMRLFKRGDRYDIYPLTAWRLRKYLDHFIIYDYTQKIIQQPERFGLSRKKPLLRLLANLPTWMILFFLIFVPNFNWILVKKKSKSQ
jgi:SAM-dependent methyltransferase